MNYRDWTDRKISAYGAILAITVFGAIATIMIVHVASKTILTPDTETGVLSALN